MASSDDLIGAACPPSSSSPYRVPLENEERSMPTIDISQREELRGLGGELIRLDVLTQGHIYYARVYVCAWKSEFSSIVAVADRDLHDALHPYGDPDLVMNHGEQLLDFVIRLASEQQWKCWIDTSVILAAITGATEVLLRLFASCGDPMGDETLSNLLSHAADRGNVETLSAIIAAFAGPLVGGVDEVGWPFNALHSAAKKGHRSCVAKLIKAGVPVDTNIGMEGTALTEAVEGGHKDVALDLLAAGADVNTVVAVDINFYHSVPGMALYNDCTPLCIAVERDCTEMVNVLLEAGGDPSKGPPDDLPLQMAASRGSCMVLNSLILAGASVSSVDADGRSALHNACAYNQPEAVDLLLLHNSSVVALCNSGRSPLDVVGTQVLTLRERGKVPTRPTAPTGQVAAHVLAQMLRQRAINPPPFGFCPTLAHPCTLNSAETSTVDKICGILQSTVAWRRRGWLVMMRSRPLAEVVEQPNHGDADAFLLPVRDVHSAHEPSRDTVGIREEGGVALALHGVGGHARTDGCGAVVWVLRGPDESLFRNIVRLL